MANRTPNGHNRPTADSDATMPVWTAPRPGGYDPAGPDGLHRHGDGRAELHAQGDRPHYHDDDSGIVVFLDDPTQPLSVPAESGDGPAAPSPGGWFDPSAGADQPADPTPASRPDVVAASETAPSPSVRDGGRAGAGRPTPPRDQRTGRFLVKPAIPPMSAELAQALLDADAEVWRVDTTLRTAGVLVFAVEFDDLVRHGGGDAP